MSSTNSVKLPPLVVAILMLAVAVSVGALFGRGVGFLVGAGLALATAIWLLWKSIQSLTGDTDLSLEEALGLGAPSIEEERKHAVLRALKDLEFEKAVGKISDADYNTLVKKYRADAKRLLNQVDESLTAARQKAEALLEKRLAEAGTTAKGGANTAAVEDDKTRSKTPASNEPALGADHGE